MLRHVRGATLVQCGRCQTASRRRAEGGRNGPLGVTATRRRATPWRSCCYLNPPANLSLRDSQVNQRAPEPPPPQRSVCGGCLRVLESPAGSPLVQCSACGTVSPAGTWTGPAPAPGPPSGAPPPHMFHPRDQSGSGGGGGGGDRGERRALTTCGGCGTTLAFRTGPGPSSGPAVVQCGRCGMLTSSGLGGGGGGGIGGRGVGGGRPAVEAATPAEADGWSSDESGGLRSPARGDGSSKPLLAQPFAVSRPGEKRPGSLVQRRAA